MTTRASSHSARPSSRHIATMLAFAMVATATAEDTPPAAPKPLAKEKLQIVFLLGQSNMVGMAQTSV